MGSSKTGKNEGVAPDPVQVLHRDLSTQSQLGILLTVSESMMKFLCIENEPVPSGDGGRQVQLNGESRIAAEATLIRACNRIDLILDDDKRWGLEFQTRLEALFEKNTEIARDIADRQKKLIDDTAAKERALMEAALEAKTPHNLFRPSLSPLGDGNWIAYVGDPDHIEAAVIGSGPSPAAALKAFDLAFNGELSAEQQRLVEQVKNETNTLDKTDAGHPDQAGAGREDQPRDSRPASPEL
jgi:hypothetical protein